MADIREEQLKLLAGYLNITAAGSFVTGAIAPGVALIAGSVNGNSALIVTGAIIAFVVSLTLHILAQAILRRL